MNNFKFSVDLSKLLPQGKIERAAKIYRLEEEPSEIEQWLDFTAEQRLQKILEIRTRYLQWRYDTEPRLERVLTITRKT